MAPNIADKEQVNFRIASDDLEEVRRRAAALRIPYQTYLRSLVHQVVSSGEHAPRWIWKFIVPSEIVAVTIAATEEDARANLEKYANEQGLDCHWLQTARVVRLPLEPGVVVAWAQV
jgi:hypothetical protein